MSYRTMLISELNYYISRGYIPRIKICLMKVIEMEKIVDYCFCIEHHNNYDDFIKTTTTGYVSNIKEIEKIINKYRSDKK